MTTQELIVTRMLMFMMTHCAEIADEGWEYEYLPYIGIEPGIA